MDNNKMDIQVEVMQLILLLQELFIVVVNNNILLEIVNKINGLVMDGIMFMQVA